MTLATIPQLNERYLEALEPLRALIEDDSLTEIMVNGPDMIYVERNGKILLTDVRFADEAHLLARHRQDRRRCRPPHRRSAPRWSTPACLTAPGSTRSSRRSRRRAAADDPQVLARTPYQVADLIDFGTIDPGRRDLPRRPASWPGANIIISGGTGAGKTTLLNVLLGLHPARRADHHHRGRRRAPAAPGARVPAGVPAAEHRGRGRRSTIRDLVRNALRMRPDRIVVGECRGGEALDMLQAMNTGHDGSMTTVHANSPRDALARLETMVLMAGMDLPAQGDPRADRQRHQPDHPARPAEGRVADHLVTEVVGMEGETITMQEIFKFESRGADPATGQIVGDFSSTGIRPKIIDRLFEMGVPLPPRLATLFPDRRQLQRLAALGMQPGNGTPQGMPPEAGMVPPPGMPPGAGVGMHPGMPPAVPPGIPPGPWNR